MRRAWMISTALLLAGCGARVAGSGGEEEAGGESETGSLPDLPEPEPEPEPEPTPERCDCEPGTTCVITFSDAGCQAGCRELPPSCGDEPSCDPACNWELCKHVACHGEQTRDCPLVFSNEDPPVTGWVCSEGMLCNPWINDCPSEEKCRPYDRGSDEWWHSSACDWVVEPAEVGDPCERSEGVYTGKDNCEDHAICWDVDPVTQLGTCVPLCSGAPHAPICPEDTRCALAHPMNAAFCLPPCDPLADACSPGYTCSLVGDTLACMPERSEPAALGDPCTYPNDCATGLACVAGACVQVCDLDAPACPAEAPSCTPALTEAVTGVEHVGLCS